MDHVRTAALTRDHIQELLAEADRARRARLAARPSRPSGWRLDAVRGPRRITREALEPGSC